MLIESLEDWYPLAKKLAESGYKLWQMQYSIDSPEGFQARFRTYWDEIEVVTHNKAVYKAIVKYPES